MVGGARWLVGLSNFGAISGFITTIIRRKEPSSLLDIIIIHHQLSVASNDGTSPERTRHVETTMHQAQ